MYSNEIFEMSSHIRNYSKCPKPHAIVKMIVKSQFSCAILANNGMAIMGLFVQVKASCRADTNVDEWTPDMVAVLDPE